ncbi:MAG TPA: homoserine dehydrogenase [Pirellulales bacterium]|jgi:homoserine dehydrogenase|nr:homoserine dehydrogenase [Pirellulales bacterium]
MDQIKVAIVGMGTVGTGVARLLVEHGERAARHSGRQLVLESVVVRDEEKPRDLHLPSGVLSSDLQAITHNPEIKVVAHLVGGLEPARQIMLELLENGKDVVTANKALLAEHGPELFDRARALDLCIAFEAAVAGGIPIIANISQCLSANQIQSLRGILNGTSNFILTQMEEQGADYSAAVKEAQRLGYAEADPTLDVDGSDATQKLAILAHLAFGARVNWRDIPRRGIDGLDAADLRYAKELGYRIKLVAMAQLAAGGVNLQVSPTLVKIGAPLAEVRGAFNAISVVGDAVGPLMFHGQGAGQMPTASAVVADMIDMVVGRAQITFRNLELWTDQASAARPLDPAKSMGKFYLRFMAADQPGVLAEIAGVLGKNKISIASVIQHDDKRTEDGFLPLVIMTHSAAEGDVLSAIETIDKLRTTKPFSVRLRVQE